MHILALCLMLFSAMTMAKSYVCISFSMPENLLQETLNDSTRLHIPAILNGLYHNSMPDTVTKIMALSQSIPDLQLQIDPTVFERFAINQVPALVVEKAGCFDVIYGTLPIAEGLERIQRKGECHHQRSKP